ncbi:hypothetical protein CEW46_21540 [Bacillus cereus]|nr:hypothetical protein CEW46_21540 [Bacillus cereus]
MKDLGAIGWSISDKDRHLMLRENAISDKLANIMWMHYKMNPYLSLGIIDRNSKYPDKYTITLGIARFTEEVEIPTYAVVYLNSNNQYRISVVNSEKYENYKATSEDDRFVLYKDFENRYWLRPYGDFLAYLPEEGRHRFEVLR